MRRRLFALLLCGLTLFSAACTPTRTASRDFFAMDTYLTFSCTGPRADDALKAAEELVLDLAARWSVTDPDSELYAVNHSGGAPVSVSDETADLLRFALEQSEATGGALDPTIYPVLTAWGFTTSTYRVPDDAEIARLLQSVGRDRVRLTGENTVRLDAGTMLDFGAVAKGYAGDLAARLLREKGVTSALLALGGNIQAVGRRPDGSDWRVGVQDPAGNGSIGVLSAVDCAVVTSGNYARYFTGPDGRCYGHILDPATGRPVENGLQSVTVSAEEGRLCDALSTALFVMGEARAVAYWRAHRDFEMILLTDDGRVLLTEGLRDRFTLDADHAALRVEFLTAAS